MTAILINIVLFSIGFIAGVMLGIELRDEPEKKRGPWDSGEGW